MLVASALLRREGKRIGFVPTMGALHEGHLSLLRRARELSDATVASIFVNPAQFGAAEDFQAYPRPLERDCRLLEDAGCDLLFAPSAGDMYPRGYSTYVNVEGVSDGLCGASRPGHFRGVATVVLKFFNIVDPDVAVFGRKDAQQVMVLKRMAQDLNLRVRIEVAPTVREPDGLAMSSRNAYLTPAERRAAPLIYAGLRDARAAFEKGERSAARLRGIAADVYARSPLLTVEYIEFVDPADARHVETVDGATLAAVACRTVESRTRLIDNVVLGGDG
jgi:pantoate--beta-alanine ligase